MTRFLLFESLRGVPGNEGLKGCELKDSFMGGEEADLVMLTASHEEISQEELAHEKDGQDPHCKTAERLAGMVKSQLSDYAKKRLQAQLEKIDFDRRAADGTRLPKSEVARRTWATHRQLWRSRDSRKNPTRRCR